MRVNFNELVSEISQNQPDECVNIRNFLNKSKK